MARGKGKEKIEMTKLENDNDLREAFSKRCTGLFRCADHLYKHTGAHNAIIVFSPGNKAFSFGCPDVEHVISRYRTQMSQRSTEAEKMQELQQHVYLERLDADLKLMQHQLEFEKKRAEFLDQINGEGSEQNWWEDDVENMNVDQLEALKVAMMDLKERILNEQEELLKQEILRKPDPCEIGSDAPFDCSEASGDSFGNEQKDLDGF